MTAIKTRRRWDRNIYLAQRNLFCTSSV